MKEKILELRKKGLTINEIVDIVGCAKSTVSYHINNAGLGGVRDSFISDIDDFLIEKIKGFRKDFKTYDEICVLLKISRDKLKKICREYNLNFSTNRFKKKELDGDEVIKKYLEFKSIRKTAKYFKSDKTIIRRFLPNDIIGYKRPKNKTKSQAVIDWRKRSKEKLIEYKGGKCEKCGYNKCIGALEFHHVNPDEKDFAISSKSYSFERLKKEADKCLLVCANCHTEIHEELRNKN